MTYRTRAGLAVMAGAVLLAGPSFAQGVTQVQAGGWMSNDFHGDANPGCSVGVDGSEPGSRMILGFSRKRPDLANLVFRRIGWTIAPGLPITVQALFNGVPMQVTGTGRGNTISVDLSGETQGNGSTT